MTDKNGVTVLPGCWVLATPDGGSQDECVMMTEEVTGSERREDVEVVPPEHPAVQSFFEQGGFEGGGGTFGGGGASGSW